ncbi:hypothetical protein AAP_00774 [Ascosphaera apis ARSEF 7405]|uniref:Uncharacterized protein n=1 Tax=Ascosphaera apis ARSEF 7405 TaxID=392613 RepID=A0A168CXM4_9EURO|nr:hypothetical protein AAP_00774 [Ascosphaera apis ARSEF 7405]
MEHGISHGSQRPGAFGMHHHSDPIPERPLSARKERVSVSIPCINLRSRTINISSLEKAPISHIRNTPKAQSYVDRMSSSSSFVLDMNCAMSQPPFPSFQRSKTPTDLPSFGTPQALSCDYRSLSLSIRRKGPADLESAKENITCLSIFKRAWETLKTALDDVVSSFTTYEPEPFDMPGPLRSRGVIAMAPDGTPIRTYFPRRQSAHGTGMACHPYLRGQEDLASGFASAASDCNHRSVTRINPSIMERSNTIRSDCLDQAREINYRMNNARTRSNDTICLQQ